MGFYLSIILSVVLRLVPHPANVTPLGSLIFIESKKSGLFKGILLGIIVMIISDIFLGFSVATPFVYLGFAAYALFGSRLKKVNPVAGVLLGSIAFFLISNFGVWLGPWYTHTLSGFVRCYVNALPFFRNTLVGDLAFITVLTVAQSILARLNIKFDINLREALLWPRKLHLAILKKK